MNPSSILSGNRKFLVLGLILLVAGIWYASSLGSEDKLGLSVVLVYEDGTNRSIDPGSNPLSAVGIPLSVQDTSGKTLSRIDYTVKVYSSWDSVVYGAAKSSLVNGGVGLSVGGTQRRNDAISYSTTLSNGATALVKSGSISAYDLQSWGSTSGSTLVIMASADIRIDFTSSPSLTATKEGQASIGYKVTPTTTVLSVIVDAAPI